MAGGFKIICVDPVERPRKANGRRAPTRWTVTLRARFLDHLSMLCSVRAAARAIDVQPCSCYVLRRRDPAFAAAWDEALALGYQAVETRLISAALSGPSTEPGEGFDRDLAKWLLRERREFAATATRRKGGPIPRRATIDETDRAILAKLAAIEAGKARA